MVEGMMGWWWSGGRGVRRGRVVWWIVAKGGRGAEGVLILGPVGFPPERGGPVSKVQEGRETLCSRGPGLLCFVGLPGGKRSAFAVAG